MKHEPIVATLTIVPVPAITMLQSPYTQFTDGKLELVITEETIVEKDDHDAFNDNTMIGSYVASSARGAATIALASSQPGNSILLDKLAATFLYLKMVAGPSVFYPDLMLKNVISLGVFPFSLPNPSSVFESNDGCHVIDSLRLKDVECSILYNYGEDLFVLLYFLVLSSIIQLLPILLAKLQAKNERGKEKAQTIKPVEE